MKKIYYIFILFIIFSTGTVSAQKMKIIRCTTPTIIINGEKLTIGDTFDKNSKISWISSKQVLIAKDPNGYMVRYTSSQETEKSTFFTSVLNTQYKELSSRDFDTNGIDGKYIIDKQLILPTGLNADTKYTVELHYTIDGKENIYKAKLSADNSTMIIKKKIFNNKYKETIKARIIAYDKKSNQEILLSNNIEFIHIERAIIPD
ncbi:MAG: hypothetical protein IKU35_06135 [Bacteroidaceae bacterium]|nr:hypothetical protein [Bacteroidaceae bacterium]